MSTEQSADTPQPARFNHEAFKLASLMVQGVKNSFELADGIIYAEACCYAFSMLLLVVAAEGKGDVMLRKAADCLERIAVDANAVEALRAFMRSGDQVRH